MDDTQSDPKYCVMLALIQLFSCVLLFILSPMEWVNKASVVRGQSVRWQFSNVTRFIVLITVTICKITVIGLQLGDIDQDSYPQNNFWSDSVVVIALIWSGVLLLRCHRKNMMRSGLAWTFVLTMTGVSVIETISLMLPDVKGYRWNGSLMQTLLFILLLILCSLTDDPSSRKENQARERLRIETSPRVSASFPSLITFSWCTRLAWKAWKRVIPQDELHPLVPENQTTNIGSLLEENLNQQRASDGSVSVMHALWRTFRWEFAEAVVWNLIAIACDLSNPLLQKELLIVLTSGSENSFSRMTGYQLAVALFVTRVVKSLTEGMSTDRAVITGVRMKTALMACLYRKSFTVSRLESDPRGESYATSGEVMNLIANDAEVFQRLSEKIHTVYTVVIMLTAGMYFLFSELGFTGIISVAFFSLIIPFNIFLMSKSAAVIASQRMIADQRYGLMSEILQGIRIIKMHAWEIAFMKMIDKIRITELRACGDAMRIASIAAVSMSSSMVVFTLITFTTYVLADDSHLMTSAHVFPALTFIVMLYQPLSTSNGAFSHIPMALVAIRRLNQFLSSDDQIKYISHDMDSGKEHDVMIENAALAWSHEVEINADTDSAREIHSSDTISPSLRLVVDGVRIRKGSLVAVIGSVASGKSSLLSAILGDMLLMEGSVTLSPRLERIAYIPQSAWILNQTVKSNILFGRPEDGEKYDSILSSCELLRDLSLLSAGDETEIGENGVNLSGGQKQRISIARACYSDADLILADDPLSAVDAHVAAGIFQNVFSSESGILKGKTRIMATNNLTFLKHFDMIIVMDGGHIVTTGTWEELTSADSNAFTPQDQSNIDSSVNHEQERSGTSDRVVPVSKPDAAAGTLIKDEEMESGTVRMSVFISYFNKMTTFAVTFFLLYCVSFAMEGAANVWLSSWTEVTDSNSGRISKADLSASRIEGDDVPYGMSEETRILILALISASSVAFNYFSTRILVHGCLKASVPMHYDMLMSVMRSPMSFFETTPTGRIMNRFVKDMNAIDRFMFPRILQVAIGVITIVTSVVVVAAEIPVFVITLIPVSLILLQIQQIYLSAARQLWRLEATMFSHVLSHVSETLTGITSIKAYDSTDRLRSEFDQKVDHNIRATISLCDMMRWRNVTMDLAASIFVLVTSAYAVYAKDEMSAGVAGLAITLTLRVSLTLRGLVLAISDMETEAVSIERILEYSRLEAEAGWESKDDSTHPPPGWPDMGGIEFKDLSLRYRPGLDLALRNLCLSIQSGEKVGVAGRTGAGKSTITLSLLRMMEPAEGCIIIDGINVNNIGLHALRSAIAIIPQEPVLFSTTLRGNLDPLSLKSDDQLWSVLDQSLLRDYFQKQANGLEFLVKDAGKHLSSGQRQLLCLARALLHKKKILLLDEATASVDHQTDELIQKVIREQFCDCTIITIAHRINTILDSDKVLIMDGGSLSEFDSPSNLLTRKDSLFSQLVRKAGSQEY